MSVSVMNLTRARSEDDVSQGKHSPLVNSIKISPIVRSHSLRKWTPNDRRLSVDELLTEVRYQVPSNTVPFAKVIDENPFETFMPILRSMGFGYDESEVALVYTKCKSVEEAIDFIVKHPDAIYHPFRVRNADLSDVSIEIESINLSGSGGNNEDKTLIADPLELLMQAQRSDVCAECGLSRVFHLTDQSKSIIEIEDFTLDSPVLSSRAAFSTPRQRSTSVPNVDVESLLTDNEEFNDILISVIYDPANAAESASWMKETAERIFDVKLIKSGRKINISSNVLNSLSENIDDKSSLISLEDGSLCLICGEVVLHNNFHVSKCGHGFCVICLKEYYKVKISSSELEIVCADFSCKSKISDEEIISLIQDDNSIVAKFKRFKRNMEAARNPNVRWCPKPDCENAIVGDINSPRLECGICNTVICFNCNQLWHEGKKCEEVVDQQYAEWANGRDIQTCPQCRARIEKDLGCNHMTCPACSHEFCWLCRLPYYSGHFSPFNPFGCPGMQYVLEDPDSCRPGAATMCFLRFLFIPFALAALAIIISLGAAAFALGIACIFPILCYKFEVISKIKKCCCNIDAPDEENLPRQRYQNRRRMRFQAGDDAIL